MDTSSGKPKKTRPKKIFIGGMIYVPKMDPAKRFEMFLQFHYNAWLGWNDEGEENIKVTVTEVEYNKEYRFDFHRVFGSWYCFTPSSDQDRCIFQLDEQLVLAEDYQTGTTADLNAAPGRYLIYHDVRDFTKHYKEIAKAHKASRIKDLKYQQIDRDNISITVYL